MNRVSRLRPWMIVTIIYAFVVTLLVPFTTSPKNRDALFNSGNFAVDSSGIVYLRTVDEIVKFKGDVEIGCISVPKKRSFAFTIVEKDEILLSNSETVFLMDTDGTVIKSYPDEDSKTFHNLCRLERTQNDIFEAADGHTYTRQKDDGIFVITDENGNILYRSKRGDAVANRIKRISFLSYFIVVPVLVIWAFLDTKKTRKPQQPPFPQS